MSAAKNSHRLAYVSCSAAFYIAGTRISGQSDVVEEQKAWRLASDVDVAHCQLE